MSSGGTKVGSALTWDQQHIIEDLRGMLMQKDINGNKHGSGYGLFGQGPTPYTGPLTAELHPGIDQMARVATHTSPYEGIQQNLAALSPLLSGQKAYDFKDLTGMGPLKMGDLSKPNPLQMQQYGSTYNYNPSQVKSTMDNSKFTQDYFEKGIKAPLMRTYENDILPQLNDNAASAGNTFSSRTTFAKGKALQGLQTDMTAQLSNAVRQDEIERSQQNLAAQQFNVQSGMQNAQFGAGQNLAYAGLNSQNALSAYGLNSQNALNYDTLNTNRALQSYQQSAANKLAYDQLNTQTKVSLGENAMNRRLQGVSLATDVQNQPWQRALQGQALLAPLQNQRTAEVNANYNEFMRTQPENSPWIKLGLSLAGTDPHAFVAQQRSPMDYALGALGAANVGADLYSGYQNQQLYGGMTNPTAANYADTGGGWQARAATGEGNTVSSGPNALQQAGQYAGYASSALGILSLLGV